MITAPGIYYDIDAASYHRDPCVSPSLSSSIAKKLVSASPMHAFCDHPKLGGAESADEEESDPSSTKAKVLGELIHKLMLGRGGEIEVIEADNYKTVLARAQRDAAFAGGKIPVLKHKLPEAQMAADDGRRQLDMMGFKGAYRDGQNEVVLIWQEEGGVWMRAMLDYLKIDENTKTAKIRDIKSVSRSSHPEACAAQINKMGYDLSASFYRRGLSVLRPDLAGRIEFEWDFIEVAKPYALTPVTISAEWQMAADMRCEKAVGIWRQCIAENRWPYYTDHTLRLEPKPWMIVSAFTDE